MTTPTSFNTEAWLEHQRLTALRGTHQREKDLIQTIQEVLKPVQSIRLATENGTAVPQLNHPAQTWLLNYLAYLYDQRQHFDGRSAPKDKLSLLAGLVGQSFWATGFVFPEAADYFGRHNIRPKTVREIKLGRTRPAPLAAAVLAADLRHTATQIATRLVSSLRNGDDPPPIQSLTQLHQTPRSLTA